MNQRVKQKYHPTTPTQQSYLQIYLESSTSGYSLTWCKSIFAYLGSTAKDTVSLRSYCKLFSKALKPLPCWTSFPHPKYSTLNKLFGRFDEVSGSGSTNVPKVLLIDNGVIAVGVFVSKTVFSICVNCM